jgi:1-deoxy-D-xylulose-5-phosphate reductoisomerase
MKRLVILGSTGSIGTQTLEVVRALAPSSVSVVGLAARRNVTALVAQAREFRPKVVAVADEASAADAAAALRPLGITVCSGPAGVEAAAAEAEADLVVNGLTGSDGLAPTVAAIEAGCDVALANKETVVMAGRYVLGLARRRGVTILPVDSEHSSLFQLLAGRDPGEVSRLILTASGGPFVDVDADALAHVTVEAALQHPVWDMGDRITIDSATLMNKGLEVIEARWLFDIPSDRIDVVVHRQSVVHGMVGLTDGTCMAHLGVPDMRAPIQYALTYPFREPSLAARLDMHTQLSLTFERPDLARFPCLRLAYEALRAGGTTPACLNAANEVAVGAFLVERLPFLGIPAVVERVLEAHQPMPDDELGTIRMADCWARERALEAVALSANAAVSVG